MKELKELMRVAKYMAKGQGSTAAYLVIPILVTLHWIALGLMATSDNSPITPELPLFPSPEAEFDLNFIYTNSHISSDEARKMLTMPQWPPDKAIHLILIIPYLGANPLVSAMFLEQLEWILIYSSAKVHFHFFTTKDSVELMGNITRKLHSQDWAEFSYDVLTLTEALAAMNGSVCPSLSAAEDFCLHLLGQLAPLVFAFLFPSLDQVIYIDKTIIFQEDVAVLADYFDTMRSGRYLMAMANEQSAEYYNWMSSCLEKRQHSGFNPQLILLDLDGIRRSDNFKRYLSHDTAASLAAKKYRELRSDTLNIGQTLNILACEDPSLVMPLDCSWNILTNYTMNSVNFRCISQENGHVWNNNE